MTVQKTALKIHQFGANRMKKLLLIAALLFSGMANALVVSPTLPLVDNIYYVSTSAKGGNNSNPCTKTRPCLTLAGAAAKVTKAGSIIHVNTNQGDFVETAQTILAVGVTLECDGVTATGAIKAGSALDGMIRLISTTEGTYGNQEVRNCKIDGNSQTGSRAIHVFARSNVKVHDLVMQNWNTNGIMFSGTNSLTYYGGYEIAPTVFATGNEIYNVTITNSASAGNGNINYGGQDGILIHDNVIDVQRRTTDSNSGYGIKYLNGGFSKNERIYNNTITKPTPDGTANPSGVANFAIEYWSGLGGTKIYNNTIQGVVDIVHTQKGESKYSVELYNNRFGYSTLQTANYIPAIVIEDNTNDVLVRNNYARNMGLTQPFVQMYGANFPLTFKNITIYNNIVTGARLFVAATNYSIVSNLKINLNTIFWGASAPGSATVGIELQAGQYLGLQVADNIFYNHTYNFMYNAPNNGLNKLDQADISNNIHFPASTLISVVGTQAATNVTALSNLNVDPLFKNTATPDLRLQNTAQGDGSTSPARNAGKDVGILEDYAGYIRFNTPDIGALEFPHANNLPSVNKPQP